LNDRAKASRLIDYYGFVKAHHMTRGTDRKAEVERLAQERSAATSSQLQMTESTFPRIVYSRDHISKGVI